MSRRFHPVPRWMLVALAAGVALLVHLHAHPLTRWAYADWAAASAEARQSLGLAGVLAAACAAWVGSLHSARTSATCPVPATRNGLPLTLAHVSRLGAAALIGQALGLAPTYFWCARHSSYAADLRPVVILGGMALLLAAVALGYLSGVLLPRILAVPAGAALSFTAVVAMGADGRPWSPIWPFDVVAGITETSSVALPRVAFFLTATVLLVLAASHWLCDRRASPGALTSCALVLAPVVVLGMISTARHPALLEEDHRATPSCLPAGTSTVCVHPARRAILSSLADGVRRLQEVVGPTVPLPTLVADATTWPTDPAVAGLQLQDDDRDRWRPAAMVELATTELGRACSTAAVSATLSPADVSRAAAIWWASQADRRASTLAGTGPSGDLARELADVPTSVMTARFRAELPRLRTCRASAERLLP